MDRTEIVFSITGPAYQQVSQYRLEMDLRVLSDQIKRKGRATVTRFRDEVGLDKIIAIPKIGEADPWYGDFGGGYTYILRPEAEGSALKVVNNASDDERFCAEILPPLNIHISDRVQIRTSAGNLASDAAQERQTVGAASTPQDGLTLTIAPDAYEKLAAWERFGQPLNEYEFIFQPLSVGDIVSVRYVPTREEIDLSGDFGLW